MQFRLWEVNGLFEETEVILEAKHVTRRFPASGHKTLVANNDINLKMYRGKTLGLVGESGCGKSTFMRFLVSLDVPPGCSFQNRCGHCTEICRRERPRLTELTPGHSVACHLFVPSGTENHEAHSPTGL